MLYKNLSNDNFSKDKENANEVPSESITAIFTVIKLTAAFTIDSRQCTSRYEIGLVFSYILSKAHKSIIITPARAEAVRGQV